MSQGKTLFWKKLLMTLIFLGTVLLAVGQVMQVAAQSTPNFTISPPTLDQNKNVCQLTGPQIWMCTVTLYGSNLPPGGVNWTSSPQPQSLHVSPSSGHLPLPSHMPSISVSISGLSCTNINSVVTFNFFTNPSPTSQSVSWSCSASTPSPTSSPTATATMAATPSPTNSPTATPTISATPSATVSPTPSASVSPSPVASKTNTTTSDNSPCVEFNQASGCSPLSAPTTTYSYSPGSTLTIVGEHWNKDVPFELGLVNSSATFISSFTGFALLPALQGGCPLSSEALANSSIVSTDVSTDQQGAFSTQLSIPGTTPSGTYHVCAVSTDKKPVVASQSGSSILLFDVTIVQSTTGPRPQSQEPANQTGSIASFDLFSSSLSLLSFLFAIVALLIYFFAPKRSLQTILAPVVASSQPVAPKGMLPSKGKSFSANGHQLVEEAAALPLPRATAPDLPESLDELKIKEVCIALTKGDIEPVLTLALFAQQEQLTLWEPLMEAIKQLPLVVEPAMLKQLIPDVSSQLKQQQPSLHDLVKSLILSQWLLSGITEQREMAEIRRLMGDAYLKLGERHQKNILRAIQCYMTALNILVELGDREGQAHLQVNLGRAYSYLMEGDRRTNLYQASKMYQNALAYFETTGQVQRSNALRERIEQIQTLLASQ